jgi:hypothetical protein
MQRWVTVRVRREAGGGGGGGGGRSEGITTSKHGSSSAVSAILQQARANPRRFVANRTHRDTLLH